MPRPTHLTTILATAAVATAGAGVYYALTSPAFTSPSTPKHDDTPPPAEKKAEKEEEEEQDRPTIPHRIQSDIERKGFSNGSVVSSEIQLKPSFVRVESMKAEVEVAEDLPSFPEAAVVVATTTTTTLSAEEPEITETTIAVKEPEPPSPDSGLGSSSSSEDEAHAHALYASRSRMSWLLGYSEEFEEPLVSEGMAEFLDELRESSVREREVLRQEQEQEPTVLERAVGGAIEEAVEEAIEEAVEEAIEEAIEEAVIEAAEEAKEEGKGYGTMRGKSDAEVLGALERSPVFGSVRGVPAGLEIEGAGEGEGEGEGERSRVSWLLGYQGE